MAQGQESYRMTDTTKRYDPNKARQMEEAMKRMRQQGGEWALRGEPMRNSVAMPQAGGASRADEARRAIDWQRETAGGRDPAATTRKLREPTPQNPNITNVYTDPERRAASKSRFMAAMTPQVTEGINRVTSAVDPRMRGKMGASLQQQVYAPMQQALAGFELGQEQKGTDYAANLPFRIADYTGNLGGAQTIAGRGMGLQEELGRAGIGFQERRLGIEEKAGERAETEFGWREQEQKALEEIAARTGYSLAQLELLAQTDPDKYNRLIQKEMGLLNVTIN